MTHSATSDGLDIRPAQPDDVALILDLIRGLAEYEKAPEQAKATAQDIKKALFQPNPGAHALICSVDGQPAGFALYFYNFSTWTGKSGIYLEDLFRYALRLASVMLLLLRHETVVSSLSQATNVLGMGTAMIGGKKWSGNVKAHDYPSSASMIAIACWKPG